MAPSTEVLTAALCGNESRVSRQMQDEGQVVARGVWRDLPDGVQEVNPVAFPQFWEKDLAMLVYELGEF
ncbi:MAG: hypothetical protein ACXWOV_00195 [Isosphaeraceae bacterium]